MYINSASTQNYAQWLSQAMGGKNAAAAKAEASFSARFDIKTEVAETEGSASAEPQAQTLEDVKREFYSYLDSLKVSPGLSGTSISVNVTDVAF